VNLLVGRDQDVGAWVAEQLPQFDGPDDFGPFTAIGVIDSEGYIAAGVVFHNYLPRYRNVEITMASVTPRWVSRSVLSGIMAYPFQQLGCVMVRTTTPRKNRAALTFNKKMGFHIDAVIRRGFGSQDAVIGTLLAKEWRQSKFNLQREVMSEAA